MKEKIYYGVYQRNEKIPSAVYKTKQLADKEKDYLTKLNNFKYEFEVCETIEIPFGIFRRYKKMV